MRTLPLASIALLALAFAYCAKDSSNPGEPLECRLEPVHPQVAGGPLALRFRLINRTDGPLWVLQWNTPLEGWRGTIFTVTYRGAPLSYQGPMVKRGDPAKADYVEIRPGGDSVNVSVDLAEAYDVRRPGAYRVEVTGSLLDVARSAADAPRPRDRHQPLTLHCEPLTLDAAPAAPAPKS